MYNFFWKNVSWPFTIPSWIITTSVPVLKWVSENVPQIGILTTKSICLNPRDWNREPIYLKYDKNSFMNAVGLSNPWAKAFKAQLEKFSIPDDKFLLCSIFWSDIEEFRQVAEILAESVDWFELNVSCPHATWYGQSIGQDFELTASIVREVKKFWKVVIVKPSPNVSPISELVKKCVEAGCDWFCAINTVGPWYYSVDWNSVLSNKVWGISWVAALPMWLKVVKEIRENCDLPILACWGIKWRQEVEEYKQLWAEFFGIWSSLTWMDSDELIKYFKALEGDLWQNTNNAEMQVKENFDMKYKKIKIVEKVDLSEDLTLIKFDKKTDAKFGQYVFLWIPEVWEKPFSVFLNDPFSLLIQNIWVFTSHVLKLKVWDEMYFRWPYWKELSLSWKVLITAGWSWVASFWLLQKKEDVEYKLIFWSRSNWRIPEMDLFNSFWEVLTATNDWSDWHHGFVTDFLDEQMKKFNPDYCLNCGPPMMVKAVKEIQLKYLDRSKIYSSLDKMTKCGVWICGSCTNEEGLRTCIDGPFVN